MKDEGWKVQISWKIGSPPMINVRGETWDETKGIIEEMRDDMDVLRGAIELFDDGNGKEYPIADVRAVPPSVAQPAPAPRPVASVKSDVGVEIGPILIGKIEEQSGVGKPKIDPATGIEKPGRAYTRYVVTFGSGVRASTFDSLISEAAKQLLGQPCYARIAKTKFGNDLLNIRSAA